MIDPNSQPSHPSPTCGEQLTPEASALSAQSLTQSSVDLPIDQSPPQHHKNKGFMAIPWHAIPHMRFESAYLWLIFLSSLDIMFTWVILLLGGKELNVVADAVIQMFGLPGMILFKFALVIFVIVMCEIMGRKKDQTAKMLVSFGIIVTCVPIVIQFRILGNFVWHHVINQPTAVQTAQFFY